MVVRGRKAGWGIFLQSAHNRGPRPGCPPVDRGALGPSCRKFISVDPAARTISTELSNFHVRPDSRKLVVVSENWATGVLAIV